MATIVKTYYFGHDIEIRDQVILENVVRELHKIGIDTFVWVSTKKKDCKKYISYIDILLNDDINEDKLSYALEEMKTKLILKNKIIGGNYNGS
jgi:hypothetical protein